MFYTFPVAQEPIPQQLNDPSQFNLTRSDDTVTSHPCHPHPISPTSSNSRMATAPDEVLQEWPMWTARDRVVGLRRWMMDLEWSLGAFESWTAQFMEEWSAMRQQPDAVVGPWLEFNESKASIGRLILRYIGRVMDGRLSGDLAECRDLALQIHQLGSPLYSAVIGLEVSLRWVRIG